MGIVADGVKEQAGMNMIDVVFYVSELIYRFLAFKIELLANILARLPPDAKFSSVFSQFLVVVLLLPIET